MANGNTLVVAGGVLAKAFLNRVFSFRLQTADGGFSRGPWHKSPPLLSSAPPKLREENLREALAGCPPRLSLDERGDAAVPLALHSLPPGASVVYGDADAAVVVRVCACMYVCTCMSASPYTCRWCMVMPAPL